MDRAAWTGRARRAWARQALGALLCWCGAVPARTAQANPVDTFGLGSRATALGGAVAASGRDFSMSYYNPSALALAEGTELTLGYMRADPALTLNGYDSQVDPVRGLVGGVVAPGTLGGVPFAFGVATHLSDDRISRARTVRQDVPRWVFYDNRPQLLYLSANLGVRPVDWLAVGGGITFLAATRGAFYVRGTAVLPLGTASEHDSQLEHEVDADLSAVRYGQVGVTVMPAEGWSVALVHRQSAQISLEIGARLDGIVDAGIAPVSAVYLLDSRTISAYIPSQWVLGVAYQLLPATRPEAGSPDSKGATRPEAGSPDSKGATRPEAGSAAPDTLTLEADVTLVRWSQYVSPVSRSRTDLELGAGAAFIELPPEPRPTRVLPPEFSDRVVPRLGVEWKPALGAHWALPVRAGYAYELSPVPDQSGATNFVDTTRHLVSGGVGLVWRDPGEVLPGELRLDLHAQVSLMEERTTLKASAADVVGDYRAGGSITNLGLTLGVGFR